MENNEKETTPCDGNMDHSDDTPKVSFSLFIELFKLIFLTFVFPF